MITPRYTGGAIEQLWILSDASLPNEGDVGNNSVDDTPGDSGNGDAAWAFVVLAYVGDHLQLVGYASHVMSGSGNFADHVPLVDSNVTELVGLMWARIYAFQ
eukprot:9228816-Karenia_brevis.AAC.1